MENSEFFEKVKKRGIKTYVNKKRPQNAAGG